MTEQEQQRLVQAKIDVTQRLAAERIGRYQLGAVDKRLSAYVREVAGNPQGHNLWEQLAVERFLRKCDRYGLNASEIWRFFTLYENLYFPGVRGHQTYKLTPVQCFQFANIYGFWEDGQRVVREAVLFVPRKFSKTTSTAALAVDDLLFGDANAEIYAGANSQDQAKKCFNVIRGCIRHLDPDGLRYGVNEEIIKSRRKDRSAFAQCLTAGARTKDGLNASTVIMDEFSQARDSSLLTVLTTSMGIRKNPLTVIITTASDVLDGPFYSMLEGYKKSLLGDFDDDTLFAHLFEPDIDDPEDSEDTWRKVHPHIGITVSMDFYRREYQSALRNGAEAMLAFRTKLLNIYTVNERKAWITNTMAQSKAVEFRLEEVSGRPEATVAVDLSVRDDFSAVSCCFYDKPSRRYYFHTAYFFPEGALAGHPNEMLYRGWAQDGHLTLLPGEVIDYAAITEYLLKLNRYIRVLAVGYDPYKSEEMVNMLRARILKNKGNPNIVQGVRQTNGNFTASVQAFEHGMYSDRIRINANPINYYCFGNAVLSYDRLGNPKPEKYTHNRKIDGVITMLMCLNLEIDINKGAMTAKR